MKGRKKRATFNLYKRCMRRIQTNESQYIYLYVAQFVVNICEKLNFVRKYIYKQRKDKFMTSELCFKTVIFPQSFAKHTHTRTTQYSFVLKTYFVYTCIAHTFR